jgi:anti-sigma factor RsiW
MNSPQLPSDERLSAWLDDELSPEQRAEAEAWLRTHPEDAARVRLWAADRDAVRARLEPDLEEAVPTRLEQVVWSHAPAVAAPGWSKLAAATVLLAAGVAVGAGAMWRFHPDLRTATASPASGWAHRAAVAHAVYVPEVRHPVEVSVGGKSQDESRAQEEHLQRWLTKRLDLTVKLFDLRAQGFELVGGRLLPDAAGPTAQLMYQPVAAGDAAAANSRVTVYLRKPEAGRPTTDAPAAFRFERQGELNTFYWVEGRTGYAIVGALPREKMLALAEAIYAQGDK